MSSSGSPSPQTGSKPAGRCGHGQSPHSAFGFIYGKGDIVRPKRPTRPDPPHPRPPPVRSWVVAVLSYGMVSMYWCCWLSIESGCCSVRLKKKKLDGTPRSVGLMVFGRQGIRVPDPLPPHPMARTQNNNPIPTTVGITNACSSFHSQG